MSNDYRLLYLSGKSIHYIRFSQRSLRKNFALFAVKNLRLTAKNAKNAQSTQRVGLFGK